TALCVRHERQEFSIAPWRTSVLEAARVPPGARIAAGERRTAGIGAASRGTAFVFDSLLQPHRRDVLRQWSLALSFSGRQTKQRKAAFSNASGTGAARARFGKAESCGRRHL